jgi:hypothetical protein
MPMAMINNAVKNNAYWCKMDTGKNNNAPKATTKKPILHPIL